MSHFVTYVVIPKGIDDSAEIKAHIEQVMAPYNENIEVPRYETDCSCVGRVARREAWEAANAAHGTIDSYRDRWHSEIKHGIPEEDHDREWQALIKDRVEAEERAFEEHPLSKAGDPTCDYEDGSGCKGTGRTMSTYNPKSKWDWWVIGGRWDGCIQGEDDPQTYEEGWAAGRAEDLSRNSRRVGSLKKVMRSDRSIVPFSVIDTEGGWHEKGEMGWWGMVSDEKEGKSWHKEALEIVAKHDDDCFVVALDLHI